MQINRTAFLHLDRRHLGIHWYKTYQIRALSIDLKRKPNLLWKLKIIQILQELKKFALSKELVPVGIPSQATSNRITE